MKLKLLDINRFIEKNQTKEVTSHKIYVGGGREKLDPKGLFSEEIFGRIGSRQRKSTFGYVNLNTTVIHPEAYSILTSLNTDLTKLILEKAKYRIENGQLIIDDDGNFGVRFFIDNFDNIDFQKLSKDQDLKTATFIKKNKNKILIDKFLILPAGIRDIQISKKTGKSMIQYSDIATLYERLLRQISHINPDTPPELADLSIKSIQRILMDINTWIKNRIKGKQGVIRGGILKKITDYSARIVITPDPELKLGYVGVPWQIVLKLFEPFSFNYILKKNKDGIPLIKKYMNVEDDLDINELRLFLGRVNNEPESVNPELENYLIECAKAITTDKVLVYKRDPAEDRDSWISAYIRVDTKGHIFKVNPFDLNKNGGDYRLVSYV